MPNYCRFTMAVAGYHSNVDAFINVLNYKDENHQMYRVFEADVYDRVDINLWSKAYITGDCAWSVYVCMLPGFGTYFSDDFEYTFKSIVNHKEIKFIGTNCLLEAKRLNLTIEIYSEEPGMQFCECYKILPNGILSVDKQGKFESWWIEDYQSYNDMVEDYTIDGHPNPIPFTEEEFNELKENGDIQWVNREFDFDDTIPDRPKRLVKSRMYHLTNSNEEYIPYNKKKPLKLKMVDLFPYDTYNYLKFNHIF